MILLCPIKTLGEYSVFKAILKYAAPTLIIIIAGIWLVSSEYWPFLSKDSDQFAKCRSNTITGVIGSIGGPFTLIDHKGVTVTDVDVITEPSLIYLVIHFVRMFAP